MGLYSGTNTWIDSVYQFEETDVVQGGPSGIDNQPLQELADRTTYLRARIGLLTHLAGNVDRVGNTSYTAADEGYLITAIATGVNTLTIADASTLTHGAIIPITSYCSANCVMNIVASAGQLFYDPDGSRTVIYMHNKEHLILVALTTHFRVVHAAGNFYCAGEEVKGRKAVRNTLSLQGQLLQRNQYPRLWEFASSLTFGQEITSESTYFTDGITYRGFFTTGDGSSTFRLPDERGLFERMMDGGRGIDLSRLSSAAGGYEADQVANHTHSYKDRYYTNALGELNKYSAFTREYLGRHNNAIGLGANTDTDNEWAAYIDSQTGSYGGFGETIVKNVGKLNLIKF